MLLLGAGAGLLASGVPVVVSVLQATSAERSRAKEKWLMEVMDERMGAENNRETAHGKGLRAPAMKRPCLYIRPPVAGIPAHAPEL